MSGEREHRRRCELARDQFVPPHSITSSAIAIEREVAVSHLTRLLPVGRFFNGPPHHRQHNTSAFVAPYRAGSKIETTGGVFQVHEDETAPRVEAGLHWTP